MIYPQIKTNNNAATQMHARTVQPDCYTEPSGNRVFIEKGEVKMELVTDTISIEEAKDLTLKMVALEYSLP